jgi:hypothetical protein
MGRVATRWFFHRTFAAYVRDLDASLPDVPSAGSMVRTAIAEADFAVIERLDPALTPAEISRRWAEGQEGHVWWLEGTPAHSYWITRKPVRLPYLGRTFRPAPGDVFVVDAFTRADLRGRGLDRLSGLDYLHRERAAGLRRSVALVASWNAPAHRVSRDRMGYTLAGSIGFHRALLARRYFATGLVRLDADRGFSILPVKPSGGEPARSSP